MIIIPICLQCQHLEKGVSGMKCKKYPDKIPSEIVLANKRPEDVCSNFKRRDEREIEEKE